MIPTWIGGVIAIVALFAMVRGAIYDMFWVVMVCTLMAGSAALTMPALGGSSVPPAAFALVFMCLRMFMPGSGQAAAVGRALRDNLFLGLYVLYGIIVAIGGPRLFAGDVHVVPLRFTSLRFLLQTVPLEPTPQNITATVYMVGTFLASVAAHVVMQDDRAPLKFVKVGVIMAWLHIFFGVTGAVFHSTAYSDLLMLMRNGNYAQLDQQVGGMSRISGIFPEPSGYATFAFIYFVFTFECWYRAVLPRLTGLVAIAMMITLIFTTSSTAYIGLGAYGTIFALRILFLPAGAPQDKLIMILAGLFLAFVIICATALLVPSFANTFVDILLQATVQKQNSDSGMQRAFWARIGWDAFKASYGLGIGPGSFRSSSFVTAVIGSVGALGSAFFLAHLLRVWKPIAASTYLPQTDMRRAIGSAASWAAFAAMIPAAAIAASSDPGTDFAILGGAALALRARTSRERSEPQLNFQFATRQS